MIFRTWRQELVGLAKQRCSFAPSIQDDLVWSCGGFAANGLFAGLPYALGISGGFASPFAARLLPEADLVLVFGASANHWTTKHGSMIGADARVIQIDSDPRAIGRNRPVDLAIIGDAKATAKALTAELAHRNHANKGFRTDQLADEISRNTWRDDPYEDEQQHRNGRPESQVETVEQLV